jgi:putative peptidoglycan lipid II flippase
MNLAFLPFLGHAALALSIGLGALLNAGWLLHGLLKLGVYQPAAGWAAFAARVLAGCVALGAALAWAARGIDWIALQATPWQRAAVMAGVLLGVAALYFGVLRIVGLNLRQLARRAA